MKWEYKAVVMPAARAEEDCTTLGATGWELVHMMFSEGGTRFDEKENATLNLPDTFFCFFRRKLDPYRIPVPSTMKGETMAQAPTIFMIICANGMICPLPGHPDGEMPEEKTQPYINPDDARRIRNFLDLPPAIPSPRGDIYRPTPARCGPHLVIRYVPSAREFTV